MRVARTPKEKVSVVATIMEEVAALDRQTQIVAQTITRNTATSPRRTSFVLGQIQIRLRRMQDLVSELQLAHEDAKYWTCNYCRRANFTQRCQNCDDGSRENPGPVQ